MLLNAYRRGLETMPHLLPAVLNIFCSTPDYPDDVKDWVEYFTVFLPGRIYAVIWPLQYPTNFRKGCWKTHKSGGFNIRQTQVESFDFRVVDTTRTSTPGREQRPEWCASTNSTTTAQTGSFCLAKSLTILEGPLFYNFWFVYNFTILYWQILSHFFF